MRGGRRKKGVVIEAGGRVGIGGKWDGGRAFFSFQIFFYPLNFFLQYSPPKPPPPQRPPGSGYFLPGTCMMLSQVAYNT